MVKIVFILVSVLLIAIGIYSINLFCKDNL